MLNLYAVKYRTGGKVFTVLQPAGDDTRAVIKAKQRLEAKHGVPVEIVGVTEIKPTPQGVK